MNPKRFFLVCSLLITCVLLFGVRPVYSDEFTSSSYKVLDPVMNAGGYGTSTSFSLFGVISQISIGTSTSVTFGNNAGFLYFPFASSPIVSATAGNGQVALSWTASQGVLGWNVAGYNVGQATVSGGPYSYSSSLGNVTSSTRTGLTNGTTYYFVVRSEDAFGNSVATSSQVSSMPVAPAPTPTPTPTTSSSSGGGAGGGGGIISPPSNGTVTKVILKGRAYPSANIVVFKDGTTIATPIADQNANFQIETEVVGGIYTFSLYAIDSTNKRSITTSFTMTIPSGQTTTISDIVIAPTIGADKSQVKIGNDIKFFGYAYPVSSINVIINSSQTIADKAQSDKFGLWTYVLNSKNLEIGDHSTKSQTITPDSLTSPFSESLAFRVSDSDLVAVKVVSAYNKNGDINNDGKVNLTDFSIMLFFWNQKNPKNPGADINRDGAVNLIDFSIMLYWWTG